MSGHLVLGLGGTVDYEVAWEGRVYDALAAEYALTFADLDADAPIDDERALARSILAFVARGGGGERFVASSDIIERFAARFDTEITLGGTGVRAGIALDRLGIPTVQHLVSIDDNVRRLLPPSITYVSSATRDSLDPHLIVQFPQSARVRLSDGTTIESPAPNRLIFANDPPNREMAIAADLGDALEGAAVFLVSGFNTMKDPALLEERLRAVSEAMTRLPPNALVYYEDAGFYRRDFSTRIRDYLLSRIDVYGMNEDELQEYLGRSVDLLDADEVTAALGEIRSTIGSDVVIVHTRYWAIGVGEGVERYRDALESAVALAATRYRQGDEFEAVDVDETRKMARHPSGAELVRAVERSLPDAVGAVAYDLNVADPTTIGLGDTFVGGFLAPFASPGTHP